MAKRTFYVDVVTQVEVVIDDEFINDEFSKEFSKHFWEANRIEDHAEHIAIMKAVGKIYVDNFVEGYGNLKEVGCSVKEIDTEVASIMEI